MLGSMSDAIERYGVRWPAGQSDLKIEMSCIRHGGRWQHGAVTAGEGLSFHYERMRQLLWPDLDNHRWNQLCRDQLVANKCVVLAGPASSGKTHTAAWLFLCEYLVFPHETCVLVSSTDMRGLRGRIWSAITSLWKRAIDQYDWLPGHLLDSRVAILTDQLDEDAYDRSARDYTKCIQGIPCRNSSGTWMGINRYCGWKQKRMRLICDEAQQMEQEYIKGITNLNANFNFKCCILGNFADPMDCLGRCAEPVDGWTRHMEPRKTEIWKTFYPLEGVCVNLIGFDSPNHDYPKKHSNDPDHFHYMIGPKRIEEIRKSFGEQSLEFMSQCWGAMKVSTLSFRVLNRELCEANQCFEDVDWDTKSLTRVAFLDSAWGGDRCVFTWAEFGLSIQGHQVLRLNPPEVFPMSGDKGEEADYALAEHCKARCEVLGIAPGNFGHDSTGRGSLGTALARIWSADCNPVEFGAQPTSRPVTDDFYWNDPQTGEWRLKRCNEHYVKFVTELWFTVRYCAEAGQLRNLSPQTFEEFALRNWRRVRDDRIEIEPKSGTKERPGMKQRTGRSPDLADSAAGVVEMARRRGFRITKLSAEANETRGTPEWLLKLKQKAHDLAHGYELQDEAA